MEDWRTQASETLPELASEITQAANPMQAWIEITFEFEQAYEEPRNEDLIRRIYGYAHWFLEFAQRARRATDDPPTCVLCCLYEVIPTYQAAREDMPRWFTLEEVILMKDTFSYLTSEADFEALKSLFTSQTSLS